MNEGPQAPPGWYVDANQPGVSRWWDGAQWTEHRAPSNFAAKPARPHNQLAVIAIVLVIIGALLSGLLLPFAVGLEFGAIVLSIVAVALPDRAKRLAVAAMVLSPIIFIVQIGRLVAEYS